jgi:formylmethanofuran dehydrogenase subunit E-like metal-binding protein
MEQNLFEVLRRCTPAEARQQLNLSARDLDARVLQLTASVNGQTESPDNEAIIAYVNARLAIPW